MFGIEMRALIKQRKKSFANTIKSETLVAVLHEVQK